ncbi:hypothetical protein GEV33_009320 [Tenebrio molitor]|uniref:RNA-directed DNA polymerase n=1 Tax=Tenebrio molitor TaxID=7067 RepID=A0A8J6LHE1_TENMO|nr:hypothetical protein GEV33_009320 [Tenebrio molitor]
MFTRLPFGISCAPEFFSQKFTSILSDIKEGVLIHIDNILVHAATREDDDKKLKEVLKRIHDAGMTLNRGKCEIGVKEVKYLGYVVSEKGLTIDPSRVEAIVNMPSPTNKKEVLQILGMINFVEKFIPQKSHLLEPLTALLRKDVEFVWESPQRKALDEAKHILTKAPNLSFFDLDKQIIVNSEGVREVVAFASRTLTKTESRYAQIEKEALGLTWACEKFKEYIMGLNVVLETDHKPLLQILQTKNLDELTPRLQRFRIRLMRYTYSVKYTKGTELLVADTLSRNPIKLQPTDEELGVEIEAHVNQVIRVLPCKDKYLLKIAEMQSNDSVCRKLIEYYHLGWPEKRTKRSQYADRSLELETSDVSRYSGNVGLFYRPGKSNLSVRGCTMSIEQGLGPPSPTNRLPTNHEVPRTATECPDEIVPNKSTNTTLRNPSLAHKHDSARSLLLKTNQLNRVYITSEIPKHNRMSETSLKNSLHNLDYELYSEDYSMNQLRQFGSKSEEEINAEIEENLSNNTKKTSVFVSKNQTISDLPPSTTRARDRFIPAIFPLSALFTPQDYQPHPLVPSLAASTKARSRGGTAVVYVGLACAAIDPLIAGLICHATGQLEVLKENLQHLDDLVDKKTAKIYDEQAPFIKCNFIYGRIKECVLHYNIIIRRNAAKCEMIEATTQTDAEVNCFQPRVLLEKIHLTRCDPDKERNLSVPTNYSVFAKRITNNNDVNSTLNELLQLRQKKRVKFVKSGALRPKPDESLCVPVMLDRSGPLSVRSLETILERNCQTPPAANFEIKSPVPVIREVITQTVDGQLDKCALGEEPVDHVSSCSSFSDSNSVKEGPENIRLQFDGVTTVISVRSKEEEEESKDSDDYMSQAKQAEKYIRIKANTVHIHNHFYKET